MRAPPRSSWRRRCQHCRGPRPVAVCSWRPAGIRGLGPRGSVPEPEGDPGRPPASPPPPACCLPTGAPRRGSPLQGGRAAFAHPCGASRSEAEARSAGAGLCGHRGPARRRSVARKPARPVPVWGGKCQGSRVLGERSMRRWPRAGRFHSRRPGDGRGGHGALDPKGQAQTAAGAGPRAGPTGTQPRSPAAALC